MASIEGQHTPRSSSTADGLTNLVSLCFSIGDVVYKFTWSHGWVQPCAVCPLRYLFHFVWRKADGPIAQPKTVVGDDAPYVPRHSKLSSTLGDGLDFIDGPAPPERFYYVK